MQGKDLLKQAICGGVNIWDNKSTINWNSMPDGYRADWMSFMDLCSETQTIYQDEIFKAIKTGLSPIVDEYYIYSKNSRFRPTLRYGIDFVVKKFWYFPVGNKGTDGREVRNFYNIPATEYYDTSYKRLASPKSSRWEYNSCRRNGKLVYAFHTLPEAWEFLLGFVVANEIML